MSVALFDKIKWAAAWVGRACVLQRIFRDQLHVNDALCVCVSTLSMHGCVCVFGCVLGDC